MEITEKHAQLYQDGYKDVRTSTTGPWHPCDPRQLRKINLKPILKGLGILVAVLATGFAVFFFFTTDWKPPEITVLLLVVIAIELGEINRKLGKASK